MTQIPKTEKQIQAMSKYKLGKRYLQLTLKTTQLKKKKKKPTLQYMGSKKIQVTPKKEIKMALKYVKNQPSSYNQKFQCAWHVE